MRSVSHYLSVGRYCDAAQTPAFGHGCTRPRPLPFDTDRTESDPACQGMCEIRTISRHRRIRLSLSPRVSLLWVSLLPSNSTTGLAMTWIFPNTLLQSPGGVTRFGHLFDLPLPFCSDLANLDVPSPAWTFMSFERLKSI
jgi:hypothetical protein